MNVRIFWVRAMKCMCAQTRPRFILSSERVLGGMEFEPMLTPREKSPLPENVPRGGSNPWRCGQRAQTLPMSYSGPVLPSVWNKRQSKRRPCNEQQGSYHRISFDVSHCYDMIGESGERSLDPPQEDDARQGMGERESGWGRGRGIGT